MRVYKFFLLLIIGLSIFSGYVQSVGSLNKFGVTRVNVTEVNSERIAEIILNDAIKIKEIKVITEGNKTILKYPEYISKNGKIYPQVKILSEDLNKNILESIKTGKFISVKGEVTWEISRFDLFRKKSSLKVFAVIRFNNSVDIECKLFKNNNGFWVSWPSRKEAKTSKWIKQVLISKDIKEPIEKALIERYRTLEEEKSNKLFEEE